MRIRALLLCSLLACCMAEDVGPEGGGGAGGARPAPSEPPGGPGHDDGAEGFGECGMLGPQEVPVECEEFWLYDGYPPDSESNPGSELSLPGEMMSPEPGME